MKDRKCDTLCNKIMLPCFSKNQLTCLETLSKRFSMNALYHFGFHVFFYSVSSEILIKKLLMYLRLGNE